MTAPRIVLLVFQCLLLIAGAHPLQAGTNQAPENLDTLVALALQNNPEVNASAERWNVSVAKARQAGTLEDTEMMLRLQNALIRYPFDYSRENMTAKVIGFNQKIPFYGKRDLQRQEADFEAEAERWVVEERRIELRRLVKETWYQIYLIDRSLETVAGTIVLLDNLTRLAESMYGVGKTEQQDIFQAQLERSKMEETRIILDQKRLSLSAMLNTLVYRQADITIPPIAKVELPRLSLSAAEFESLAQRNRPAIKAVQAKINKAAVSTKLAEKEFYPDVSVSAEYMQRDPAMGSPGDDMFTAGLTVNLPFHLERRHAKVAETQAEKRLAAQELAVLKNQIHLTISDGLAQLERSRRLTRLYDQGILAQAGGTVEATMASYRTGKAKFTEVLASHIARFNFEREYHGAVADYHIQLAVLEGAAGTPLFPAP